MGPRSIYRRCRFWQKKNYLFRWRSFWSWRVCKQAKLSHMGHRKLARIHWKADVTKTSHCLVRIGPLFFKCRYSQWRLLSDHVEWIFVHKNWRGGYWQHLVSTARRYVPYSQSYSRCFAPCLLKSYYHLQSWYRLATSELRFDTRWSIICWVTDKCYADKRETIDALKDNIRECIGEIKLHTIYNVLKNWIDRVGYCMASRASHLN